jgi:hypothetical protein
MRRRLAFARVKLMQYAGVLWSSDPVNGETGHIPRRDKTMFRAVAGPFRITARSLRRYALNDFILGFLSSAQ